MKNPLKSITGPTPDPRGYASKSAIHDCQFMVHTKPTNWAYDSDLAAAFAHYKKLQAKFGLNQ